MGAYFKSTVGDFAGLDQRRVLGALTVGQASGGYFSSINTAVDTWDAQVNLLQEVCRELVLIDGDSSNWEVLLEYPLLRLEKRIDVVVLVGDIIIVIEFKIGARSFDAAAVRQVEDYALGLRDFHAGSCGRRIVPILCASKAPSCELRLGIDHGLVLPVQFANGEELGKRILQVYRAVHISEKGQIDRDEWDGAAYRPVPTIIQAAQLLYAGHTVADISRHSASIHNLTRTTERLIEIIEHSQREQDRGICFVTGVPGSGKTLTGLNAVHDPRFQKDGRSAGTFLSGNRPLVEVVREALIRDERNRLGTKRDEAERKAKTQIQHIINYLRQYTKEEPDRAPYEHAIVFDEAQRAWNAEYGARKFGREASEPELFLQIMERHKDWAVIIALVGGGQEINNGEAGLGEWGRALIRHASENWQIYVSPEGLYGGESISGSLLFEDGVPPAMCVIEDNMLHLPVPVRTFRSESVAEWVNAVLNGDSEKAKRVSERLGDYPILLTRSLEIAKKWLRRQMRGYRRAGMVASSGGKRLRAEGVHVHGPQDMNEIKHWFLDAHGDVRSSHMLEVATSEFACQGLELDFVGVCWGGDFTISENGGKWRLLKFKGSKWYNINRESDQSFLINKYRVLLTRGREGMVLWVPIGDETDRTRSPETFNQTAMYLQNCGAELLD